MQKTVVCLVLAAVLLFFEDFLFLFRLYLIGQCDRWTGSELGERRRRVGKGPGPGIEPGSATWQASALPVGHGRAGRCVLLLSH